MSDSPRRYPRPGKYEGGLIIDTLFDSYGLEGSDWIGDTETDGFNAVLHDIADYSRENFLADADFHGVTLFGADLRFLADKRFAIVVTDNLGFVSVEYFTDDARAQARWDDLQSQLAPEIDTEEMFRGYVDCALWSSTDDGTPLDATHGPDDIAIEALDSMRRDVEDFAHANAHDLRDIDPEQAGHDFWLTRNRHGAGFWDRGLGEIGQRLTDASRPWGSSDLYVGDDGFIHVTPA